MDDTKASVRETCSAINSACKSKGDPYSQYSCKSVSWDDVERGTLGGGLSCWGGNITDTRLWSKSGELLYTCRPDNWNEKLGKVNAHQVAVVVGNHLRPSQQEDELRAVTLADFLKNAGQYAAYAGVDRKVDLYRDDLDGEVSIRFQTTFLPVRDSGLSTLEFCTEAYNYNTKSDDDPRNAIILCTTQGIAYQQDGSGAKKLFHHSVDEQEGVHRYWLEAERSKHKVGGAQKETKEEALAAAARGKATASVIGIEAMGTRFNALITVQIPLRQRRDVARGTSVFLYGGGCFYGFGDCAATFEEEECDECFDDAQDLFGWDDYENFFEDSLASAKPKTGSANAARVSRGSAVEGSLWAGVTNKTPQRDPHQHITVTVVLYNTISGGVPSAEDVQAAIDDMERLYASCAWDGRLVDSGANFMKSELTAKDDTAISTKILEQPYVPDGKIVADADVFPS